MQKKIYVMKSSSFLRNKKSKKIWYTCFRYYLWKLLNTKIWHMTTLYKTFSLHSIPELNGHLVHALKSRPHWRHLLVRSSVPSLLGLDILSISNVLFIILHTTLTTLHMYMARDINLHFKRQYPTLKNKHKLT